VRALGENSIGIAVKPWVKVPDVSDAGAEINKGIVDAFRAAAIEYPAPLRQVQPAGGSGRATIPPP